MPSVSPILSVRLPEATRTRLDRAAKVTRRSRAFLMKEALDKYLDDVLADAKPGEQSSWSERLRRFEGAGVRGKGRSAADIDRQVRTFRGDD